MDESSRHVTLEIWEQQVYWTFTGWANPKFVYEGLTAPVDSFPKIDLLEGWDWTDSWVVDKSQQFGDCDGDGWMYGSSLEKITESVLTLNTLGDGGSHSFRKRRWKRTAECVAQDVWEGIEARYIEIDMSRKRILDAVAAKWKYLEDIKEYEQTRSKTHSLAMLASFHSFEHTSLMVKDQLIQLRRLKQYVRDRAMLESDYARKLSRIASKYQAESEFNDSDSTMERGTANGNRNSMTLTTASPLRGDKAQAQTQAQTQAQSPDTVIMSANKDEDTDLQASIAMLQSGDEYDQKNAGVLIALQQMHEEVCTIARSGWRTLFQKLGGITESIAEKLTSFGTTLTTELAQDVESVSSKAESFLSEIQNQLKASTESWKLQCSAIQTLMEAIEEAYAGAVYAASVELQMLQSELTVCAMTGKFKQNEAGEVEQVTEVLQRHRRRQSMAKSDMWGSVQQYRSALTTADHVVRQISTKSYAFEQAHINLTNQVRSLFIASMKLFANEQAAAWMDAGQMLSLLAAETMSTMEEMTNSTEGTIALISTVNTSNVTQNGTKKPNGLASGETRSGTTRRRCLSSFAVEAASVKLDPCPPFPGIVLQGPALLARLESVWQCTVMNPIPFKDVRVIPNDANTDRCNGSERDSTRTLDSNISKCSKRYNESAATPSPVKDSFQQALSELRNSPKFETGKTLHKRPSLSVISPVGERASPFRESFQATLSDFTNSPKFESSKTVHKRTSMTSGSSPIAGQLKENFQETLSELTNSPKVNRGSNMHRRSFTPGIAMTPVSVRGSHPSTATQRSTLSSYRTKDSIASMSDGGDSSGHGDGIQWKQVYAIATSDGYLHLLKDRNQLQTPLMTIFLKHCEVDKAHTATGILPEAVQITPSMTSAKKKNNNHKGFVLFPLNPYLTQDEDNWLQVLANPFVAPTAELSTEHNFEEDAEEEDGESTLKGRSGDEEDDDEEDDDVVFGVTTTDLHRQGSLASLQSLQSLGSIHSPSINSPRQYGSPSSRRTRPLVDCEQKTSSIDRFLNGSIDYFDEDQEYEEHENATEARHLSMDSFNTPQNRSDDGSANRTPPAEQEELYSTHCLSRRHTDSSVLSDVDM